MIVKLKEISQDKQVMGRILDKKNFGILSPGILWSWAGTRWQDGYFYSDIGKKSVIGAKQKVENVMKLIKYS